MPKSYQVRLSDPQRSYLRSLTTKGKGSSRTVYRALALLYAEQGRKTKEIAGLLNVAQVTVSNIKRRFVTEGLERALFDNPRSGKPPTLTGKLEAYVLALAKSKAPEGRKGWTLQLLADRLVELKQVESISVESVRSILKKST